MQERQNPMQNAQQEILSGRLGFESLRKYSAPYVSQHRLTVGRPPHLPCFSGQFGINELGEGQTVHQSRIEPEVEFETSFTARDGVLVTVILEGKMEFSLDTTPYCFEVEDTPIALAWTNQTPVAVARRSRQADTLEKVQVHTPLSFFDAAWRAESGGFFDSHTQVLAWNPGTSASRAAKTLMQDQSASPLRKRMATARFAVEAMDSLIENLERLQGSRPQQRISVARAYVEQTAERRPSLGEIAAATGYSVSSLQRAYRATFGLTVIEHQRQILLDYAMASLRKGGVSVGQAALAAGYSNPTNFSSAFQRAFGLSPSQVSIT
ncbi:MAG: hypothetical protein COB16_08525 [Rhodobacteraceae bacterium]|nr:MAG: hypothetical protein COB16_08525 [Paracoccaceae bacterium]